MNLPWATFSRAALPVGDERRYQRHYGDESGIGEQGRDRTGTTNVLLAITGRETEIAAQAGAQRIAIEDVACLLRPDQSLRQQVGQGDLAGTAQASEPDHAAIVPECRGAIARARVWLYVLVRRIGLPAPDRQRAEGHKARSTADSLDHVPPKSSQ